MAKEIWAPAHFSQLYGDTPDSYPPLLYEDWEAIMVFMVPADYSSMESLDLYFLPNDTKSDWDIDILLHAGAEGEAENQHSQSDTTSTYDVTADVFNVIDVEAKLATVVGQLAAGDVVRIQIINREASPYRILPFGVRFKYR